MAEKIIFDTDKSSRINRRVQEDGTLIKEADNVEFVINRNEDNIFTHSNKPGNSLFRIYPNYGLKSCDKSNKVLLLYQHQMTQIHLKNNAPSEKDHLKLHAA